MELTNTKQWKVESVVDYINRWLKPGLQNKIIRGVSCGDVHTRNVLRSSVHPSSDRTSHL